MACYVFVANLAVRYAERRLAGQGAKAITSFNLHLNRETHHTMDAYRIDEGALLEACRRGA
jgi:hypothetical protein